MMTSSTAKPERNEELNPFAIAQRQCDNAARYLPALEPGLFEFLKRPDKLTIVEFPVATSSGKVQNFVGYRCIHSPEPRPRQGWHPISSRRYGRRSSSSRFVDDLEVRDRGRPIRRSQRRCGL